MKKQHYIVFGVVVLIIAAIVIGENVTKQNVLVTEIETSTSSPEDVVTQTSDVKPVMTIQTEPAQPAYVPTLTIDKVTMKLGETKVIGGVTITVKDIKDTRCFSIKDCDAADDARVRLGVKGPVTSKNVDLIEQQGFFVDNMKVILDDVTPEVEKNKVITEADYRFVIIVEFMK